MSGMYVVSSPSDCVRVTQSKVPNSMSSGALICGVLSRTSHRRRQLFNAAFLVLQKCTVAALKAPSTSIFASASTRGGAVRKTIEAHDNMHPILDLSRDSESIRGILSRSCPARGSSTIAPVMLSGDSWRSRRVKVAEKEPRR